MRLSLPITLLALSAAVNAMPVTWYLQGVHFGENSVSPGYAFGSFTYDADTASLINWTITAPEFGGLPPFTYTTLNSTLMTFPAFGFGFQFTSGFDPIEPTNRLLNLHFDAPLTNAGITTAITPNPNNSLAGFSSLEREGNSLGLSSFRFIDAGFVSTQGPSTAPEPLSMALAGTGLAICLIWKRREMRKRNINS